MGTKIRTFITKTTTVKNSNDLTNPIAKQVQDFIRGHLGVILDRPKSLLSWP